MWMASFRLTLIPPGLVPASFLGFRVQFSLLILFLDPVVCANVLTFFYMHGRGSELAATLDWVYNCLLHRAYIEGTLYYYGGDTFLFFLSRLLAVAPPVFARFKRLFTQRVVERTGTDGSALDLAMRIIAGATVGHRMYVDYERLLKMQRADGSFPMGWAYKYGESGIILGNQGWTTALAVQAIKAFENLEKEDLVAPL